LFFPEGVSIIGGARDGESGTVIMQGALETTDLSGNTGSTVFGVGTDYISMEAGRDITAVAAHTDYFSFQEPPPGRYLEGYILVSGDKHKTS
jgi:hypothetical protein